jgi:hypothetical protein
MLMRCLGKKRASGKIMDALLAVRQVRKLRCAKNYSPLPEVARFLRLVCRNSSSKNSSNLPCYSQCSAKCFSRPPRAIDLAEAPVHQLCSCPEEKNFSQTTPQSNMQVSCFFYFLYRGCVECAAIGAIKHGAHQNREHDSEIESVTSSITHAQLVKMHRRRP